MHHVIEQNGNLTFHVGKGREDLEDIRARVGGDDVQFLSDALDTFGFVGNAVLYPVQPENVGALTSAPMLSDDVDHLDDGGIMVRGRVWWYPAYELKDFAAELLEHGKVTFQLAPAITH